MVDAAAPTAVTESGDGVSDASPGRDRSVDLDTVEVLVGVVGRAHGVRGDVSVQVRTDEPERRFAVGTVLRVEDSAQTLTVQGRRFAGGRLLVRFAEIADRNAAEAGRGLRLVTDVPADERPSEPEEYYDRQLVGLEVLAASGERLGVVGTVLHLPSQDMLEIATAEGERLIPFVEALVPEVDLAAGRIRLADVPGLLDDPTRS